VVTFVRELESGTHWYSLFLISMLSTKVSKALEVTSVVENWLEKKFLISRSRNELRNPSKGFLKSSHIRSLLNASMS
jgi:hypothetical protein